jgi:hypothetical protein
MHGLLQMNRLLHGLKQKGHPINKMKIIRQVKYMDILGQTFQRYDIKILASRISLTSH